MTVSDVTISNLMNIYGTFYRSVLQFVDSQIYFYNFNNHLLVLRNSMWLITHCTVEDSRDFYMEIDSNSQYLISNSGITPQRLSAVGYGEYRPVGSNASAEGRAANRRVDLVVLNSEAQKEEPAARPAESH